VLALSMQLRLEIDTLIRCHAQQGVGIGLYRRAWDVVLAKGVWKPRDLSVGPDEVQPRE